MKSKRVTLVLSLVLACMTLGTTLASCGSSPAATPTQAPAAMPAEAGSTATPTLPAAVPTAMPSPSATPTAAATPISGPTASPITIPTVTPVSVSGGQVVYKNISFLSNEAVGTVVTAETVPEESGGDLPAFAKIPEHILFKFEGYPVSTNSPEEPRIYVFSVAEYERVVPESARIIDTLKALLADRPDLKDVYPPYVPLLAEPTRAAKYEQYGPYPPFLPLANAAPLYKVKMDYLDFGSGTGIRYVSDFVQNLALVDPGSMFYTFQGLTDDGKYYVVGTFPVSVDVAAEPTPTVLDGKGVDDYNQSAVQKLEEASQGSYHPTLADLDAVMKSLKEE